MRNSCDLEWRRRIRDLLLEISRLRATSSALQQDVENQAWLYKQDAPTIRRVSMMQAARGWRH